MGRGPGSQRFLVVVLAHLATDRVRRELARRQRREGMRGPRREPDRAPRPLPPVLLTTRSGSTPTVVRCCAAARAAGVVPGASLARARGLLFGRPLHVQPHDPAGDADALERLARAARRYSPRVAALPPDALALEVKGSERLFQGEGALLERVLAWLARAGLDARAAVADTLGCAFAVARCAAAAHRAEPGTEPRRRGVRVPSGREREALEPLPLAALRLSDGLLEALAELGLATCGDALRLPRSEVPARLGHGLFERIDQALGARPETLARVRDRVAPRRERVFAGPVADRGTCALVVRGLLGELAADLAALELGATRVVVELWPSDGPPLELARATSRVGRDPAHLWSLLATELERAPVGFGVERLAVRAEGLERLLPRQLEADGGDAADPAERERAYWALVDALRGRLGERAAFACDAREDHRPECAFVARRPEAPPSGARVARRERPTRLYAEPLEVRVEERDGRPVAFLEQGRRTALVRTIGLERIVEPWWPGAPRPARALAGAGRAYLRALDEHGRWLWLCRRDGDQGAPRWFVHGEWC